MAGRRLLRERAGLGRSQIGDAAFPTVLLCTVAALGVQGAKGAVPDAGTALLVKAIAADGLALQPEAQLELHHERLWSSSEPLGVRIVHSRNFL